MSARTKPSARANSMPALLAHALATTLDLKLQVKQAHWNVRGPQFIALHELFDQVATGVEGFVDQLAERAVQLNAPAQGLLSDVAKNSSLAPFPAGFQDGSKCVKLLAAALTKAADVNRNAIDTSDELGDKVTADLFTQVASGLDKLRWFVEAHQK
ncbi:MAG: DNA starvation/stationary phase protection protein Dps [Alphaproteobacteria bacterium]|nr:DNA starvation/stationary phase protection protein Dps [Alphaproteobacteria bacterium]